MPCEYSPGIFIRCNSDGIFNDGKYDYDETGFPFLARLGQAVLEIRTQKTSKSKT